MVFISRSVGYPLTPGSCLTSPEDVKQEPLQLSSIFAEAESWVRERVVLSHAAASPASARRLDEAKERPNQGTRTAFGKSLPPSR